MTIPHDKINESIKAKIQTLKGVKDITARLEARQHELVGYTDDSAPLHRVDCSIIENDPAKKKIQVMIRAATIKAHEKKLAEIDNTPDDALKHFEYSSLSDADKKAFRTVYKKALAELNNVDKARIAILTGVTFD